MNDFESHLRDQLRLRAARVTGADSLVEGSRRQARRIRTRRIVGGGVLVAAATGVAIPAAMSFVGSPQMTPEPAITPGPTTEEPAPSQTPDETTEPEPSPSEQAESPEDRGGTTILTLDGLTAGAAPEIDWIEGSTLHAADGRELTVPDGVFDPLPFGDGLVGMTSNETGGWDTALVDADGNVTIHPGSSPAMSGDAELIAWYDADAGAVQFARADGGSAPEPIGVDGVVGPVGFAGSDSLVVNVGDEHLWISSGVRRYAVSDGSESALSESLLGVGAVSEVGQLMWGLTEQLDSGSCSGVFTVDSAEPLWTTCDYRFHQFSSDGRYLIGTDVDSDGAGDVIAVVMDARTGELVHQFEAPQPGYIGRTAFERDGTVLLVYTTSYEEGEGETAIIRCSFDGSCERATDVRPAELGTLVYDLSPRS